MEKSKPTRARDAKDELPRKRRSSPHDKRSNHRDGNQEEAKSSQKSRDRNNHKNDVSNDDSRKKSNNDATIEPGRNRSSLPKATARKAAVGEPSKPSSRNNGRGLKVREGSEERSKVSFPDGKRSRSRSPDYKIPRKNGNERNPKAESSGLKPFSKRGFKNGSSYDYRVEDDCDRKDANRPTSRKRYERDVDDTAGADSSPKLKKPRTDDEITQGANSIPLGNFRKGSPLRIKPNVVQNAVYQNQSGNHENNPMFIMPPHGPLPTTMFGFPSMYGNQMFHPSPFSLPPPSHMNGMFSTPPHPIQNQGFLKPSVNHPGKGFQNPTRDSTGKKHRSKAETVVRDESISTKDEPTGSLRAENIAKDDIALDNFIDGVPKMSTPSRTAKLHEIIAILRSKKEIKAGTLKQISHLQDKNKCQQAKIEDLDSEVAQMKTDLDNQNGLTVQHAMNLAASEDNTKLKKDCLEFLFGTSNETTDDVNNLEDIHGARGAVNKLFQKMPNEVAKISSFIFNTFGIVGFPGSVKFTDTKGGEVSKATVNGDKAAKNAREEEDVKATTEEEACSDAEMLEDSDSQHSQPINGGDSDSMDEDKSSHRSDEHMETSSRGRSSVTDNWIEEEWPVVQDGVHTIEDSGDEDMFGPSQAPVSRIKRK